MAYRKHFESWLETDVRSWGKNVEFYLVDSDCSNFAWHLRHGNDVYEITYSDLGEISLSSLPKKHWPSSFIREIYSGDHSRNSYQSMMTILADNISDCYI
jgi:hypothetical protein